MIYMTKSGLFDKVLKCRCVVLLTALVNDISNRKDLEKYRLYDKAREKKVDPHNRYEEGYLRTWGGKGVYMIPSNG